MKEFLTFGSKQTKKAGASFAEEILEKSFPRKKAVLIGLTGNLGGGKTTFVQGFAEGMGIKGKVLSPTFVLVKKFPLEDAGKAKTLYHIDCYRIGSKDLLSLGFKKIISDPKSVILVEWADRVKEIFPKGAFLVSFSFLSENKRMIKIKWEKL
jgi:tRNA threonylcarbamoyladenosine biosynthesis protein TsaE